MAGQIGSKCGPTNPSTATSPQLDVPVRYEALPVLEFWKFLVNLAHPEVETSESFSRLWLALDSPNFRHGHFFGVVAEMQPLFS